VHRISASSNRRAKETGRERGIERETERERRVDTRSALFPALYLASKAGFGPESFHCIECAEAEPAADNPEACHPPPGIYPLVNHAYYSVRSAIAGMVD
jgi:hypothetical protein